MKRSWNKCLLNERGYDLVLGYISPIFQLSLRLIIVIKIMKTKNCSLNWDLFGKSSHKTPVIFWLLYYFFPVLGCVSRQSNRKEDPFFGHQMSNWGLCLDRGTETKTGKRTPLMTVLMHWRVTRYKYLLLLKTGSLYNAIQEIWLA